MQGVSDLCWLRLWFQSHWDSSERAYDNEPSLGAEELDGAKPPSRRQCTDNEAAVTAGRALLLHPPADSSSLCPALKNRGVAPIGCPELRTHRLAPPQRRPRPPGGAITPSRSGAPLHRGSRPRPAPPALLLFPASSPFPPPPPYQIFPSSHSFFPFPQMPPSLPKPFPRSLNLSPSLQVFFPSP